MKPAPAREVAYVNTSLYVLKSTAYQKRISDGDTKGGGIAPLADGYLLAAGDGWMYFVRENEARTEMEVDKLKYRVPYNPDEFRDGGQRIFGDAWRDNSMDKLRIADLLVQLLDDDRVRLFVSHHYWKPDEACFVVRVSVLEGSLLELRNSSGALAWRTLYETAPCLKLNTEGGRGLRFGGLQVGGAMGMVGRDELLLTVGDQEFDGFKRSEALPQDAAASYGKVVKIQVGTGQAEVFTLGHRNPKGLYVDPDGTVWVLELGPRGGDELNRLHPGANYGWPLMTYGTDYRLHDWPLSATPGRHDGFEKPAFTFVPSIAVSQLAGVRGAQFERWRGDLLAGSFFGGLVRVRVEDGRAIFCRANQDSRPLNHCSPNASLAIHCQRVKRLQSRLACEGSLADRSLRRGDSPTRRRWRASADAGPRNGSIASWKARAPLFQGQRWDSRASMTRPSVSRSSSS